MRKGPPAPIHLPHILFFYFSILWYRLIVMNPLHRELANVEWELFLSYTMQDGVEHPEVRRLVLWSEVDRLDALIDLES
jgi:hypothetical protein